MVASSRTILRHLRNTDPYLAQFHHSQQSIYFEKLIAEAFSHILHLPFYTVNNDNPDAPHKIVWQGSTNPISKAPRQNPDAIAYCYDFCITIEATMKTGANQWSQEFAQSIRHCEDFCNQNQTQQKDAFALLVCKDIYRDTYQSIRSNPRQDYVLLPIKAVDLAEILETSILAFTIRHIEFRRLFHQLSDCIRSSASLRLFLESLGDLITNWQENVLKSEKSVFIGLKSYEAMRRIGRKAIGVSEILQRLQKHPHVGQYLNIIRSKLTVAEIENDLVQESLACSAGKTIQDNETLFEAVPCADFKGRGLRLIDAVVKIR